MVGRGTRLLFYSYLNLESTKTLPDELLGEAGFIVT